MQVIINGVPIDAGDDATLIPACEKYAARIIGSLNKQQRNDLLETLLVQSSFIAVKMGAVAAIMLQPQGRIDRGVFSELAEHMGQQVGFRFQFAIPATDETMRVAGDQSIVSEQEIPPATFH